jgi:hypothetical protein
MTLDRPAAELAAIFRALVWLAAPVALLLLLALALGAL